MLVYRIILEKYSTELIASGQPNRWNSLNVEMIYTSSSIALAALENVVHRSGEGLNNLFCLMTIQLPRKKISRIKISNLPKNWLTRAGRPFTRSIGDNWIQSKSSLSLKIPSAIIPGEHNFLINPDHSDFRKVKIQNVEPFTFDARIKRD